MGNLFSMIILSIYSSEQYSEKSDILFENYKMEDRVNLPDKYLKNIFINQYQSFIFETIPETLLVNWKPDISHMSIGRMKRLERRELLVWFKYDGEDFLKCYLIIPNPFQHPVRLIIAKYNKWKEYGGLQFVILNEKFEVNIDSSSYAIFSVNVDTMTYLTIFKANEDYFERFILPYKIDIKECFTCIKKLSLKKDLKGYYFSCYLYDYSREVIKTSKIIVSSREKLKFTMYIQYDISDYWYLLVVPCMKIKYISFPVKRIRRYSERLNYISGGRKSVEFLVYGGMVKNLCKDSAIICGKVRDKIDGWSIKPFIKIGTGKFVKVLVLPSPQKEKNVPVFFILIFFCFLIWLLISISKYTQKKEQQ